MKIILLAAVLGVSASEGWGQDLSSFATDDTRREVAFTWRNLRQQTAKREGVDNQCLADFIAPKVIDGRPSGIDRALDDAGALAEHRAGHGAVLVVHNADRKSVV